MRTIYLSSTYEDFKEYRHVVHDALRKAGYHVIAMEGYAATARARYSKVRFVCLMLYRCAREQR